MIVDVNGDGFNELIITLTDRVVRTYQWHHTGDVISMHPHGHLMPKNKWEFASQVYGGQVPSKCRHDVTRIWHDVMRHLKSLSTHPPNHDSFLHSIVIAPFSLLNFCRMFLL